MHHGIGDRHVAGEKAWRLTVSMNAANEEMPTDLTQVHRRLELAIGRVEAAHEADLHQLTSCGLFRVTQRAAILDCLRQRLFTKNWLAVRQAEQGQRYMRVIGRGNDHRVDIGTCDQCLGRLASTRAAHLIQQQPNVFGRWAIDGMNLRPFHFTGQDAGMAASHHPCAYQANPKGHFATSFFGGSNPAMARRRGPTGSSHWPFAADEAMQVSTKEIPIAPSITLAARRGISGLRAVHLAARSTPKRSATLCKDPAVLRVRNSPRGVSAKRSAESWENSFAI